MANIISHVPHIISHVAHIISHVAHIISHVAHIISHVAHIISHVAQDLMSEGLIDHEPQIAVSPREMGSTTLRYNKKCGRFYLWMAAQFPDP